jgi:putative FmdB family regulatory protein
MPILDFQCRSCGHEWEEIMPYVPLDHKETCPHCLTNTGERLPTAPGGYTIHGGNGGSTRPKGAGAFKGKGK